MTKLRVLDGERFGRLTVAGIAGKTASGNYTWAVICDCGAEKVLPSDHLVRRVEPVQSCGCLRNDRTRAACSPNPDATAFNLLVGAYRKRARIKAISFDLSESEFRALVEGDCFYCGAPPAQRIFNKSKTGVFVYNGIDKICPAGSYIAANCVTCCKACNYMKGTMSSDDFRAQVQRVFKHWCAQ